MQNVYLSLFVELNILPEWLKSISSPILRQIHELQFCMNKRSVEKTEGQSTMDNTETSVELGTQVHRTRTNKTKAYSYKILAMLLI